MIYIVSGADTNKKSAYIKTVVKDSESILLNTTDTTKNTLLEYASHINLFGESPIIIIDNFLQSTDTCTIAHLEILKQSPTIFIFKEDKMLVAQQKKYSQYATIETFLQKKVVVQPKINIFAIADSFAKKDKMNTWVLYREAIDAGLEPEPIAGMLFWKIKTMILSGSRSFDANILKQYSSSLVTLYHQSHRGKTDFTIGLEQFILSSLSK